MTLPALTLHQPWAAAIAWGTKRTENRSWAAPRTLIGSWLAIHAGGGGKADFEDACETVEAVLFDEDPLDKRGLVALIEERRADRGIVAVAHVVGCDREMRSPWDCEGQWHWRFDRVVELIEPVACKGAQGLWYPPDGVVEDVRRQWHATQESRRAEP